MALMAEISRIRATDNASGRRLLVFLITGNPGIIDYYTTFLDHVYDTFRQQDSATHFSVYGTSLKGFDTPADRDLKARDRPLNLQDQVEHVTLQLSKAVQESRARMKKPEPQTVILVGHSIGAYMLLQIVSNWQKMGDYLPPADLVGGICLFPTVVDIAKSPTGRKVAPFLALPGSTRLVQLIVRLLFYFVPLFIMTFLVRIITRFGPDAAATTASFLKSPHGVRQALYLAKDELRNVKADMWDDRLWSAKPMADVTATAETDITAAAISDVTNTARKDSGKDSGRKASESDQKPLSVGKFTLHRTKLYFYWAKNDHWVAETTRDKVIADRGRLVGNGKSISWVGKQTSPIMEIDRHGIPHAFPVKVGHSKIVAEKVVEWVREIQDGL